MKKRILLISGILIAVLLAGGVTFLAVSGTMNRGNAPGYSVGSAKINENSPVKGKKVVFLGSSVTYGYAALGNSFVDFLEHCDGIIPVKEAVSGTTLADTGKNSYVSRLKGIEAGDDVFCFICQLSTNDASKNITLGEISDSFDAGGFDTSTVAGAIEFIISYARNTWNCPVAFYTGTRYDSENYEAMVELLYRIGKKWNIDIIDLWNSEKMNSVSESDYALYMADGIHPTLAGYGRWWLPEFEEYLYSLTEKEG